MFIIGVPYSKGPTEATEAALLEAQLEDALPTEVKLPAGKLISDKAVFRSPYFSRPKRNKETFRIGLLCTFYFKGSYQGGYKEMSSFLADQ